MDVDLVDVLLFKIVTNKVEIILVEKLVDAAGRCKSDQAARNMSEQGYKVVETVERSGACNTCLGFVALPWAPQHAFQP